MAGGRGVAAVVGAVVVGSAAVLVAGCTVGQPAAPTPVDATPVATAPVEPAASTQAAPSPAGDCPGVACVSVAVTGDVLLHPALWAQARADGGGELDFRPLFAGVRPYVAASDLAVCHLETPLAAPEGPFSGYPSFNVPPQVAPALRDTGYDACTTASNHTIDFGAAGVRRTLDALDAAGLAHSGSARTPQEAQAPTLLDAGGATVAVVAATDSLNGLVADPPWLVQRLDVDAVLERAAAARAAGADLVLVAMHAGEEYVQAPTRRQREVAEALLASPLVDFVYGHHAHAVQPIEKIGGKWVAYGLGNQVAAHSVLRPENREGLLVRVRFSRDADGHWSTADVGWVPSLVDTTAPYRWCALTPGAPGQPAECAGKTDRDGSRDRIAEVVGSLGAAADGAAEYTP